MAELDKILTELVEYTIDRVYEQLEDPEPSAKISGYTIKAIANAAEQIHEIEQNIGSELMASQLRKSIETGRGRFSNEDANWVLDHFQQQRERVERLKKAAEAILGVPPKPLAKFLPLWVELEAALIELGMARIPNGGQATQSPAALKELEATDG